jgi:trehalose 6-phosphate phosphatase
MEYLFRAWDEFSAGCRSAEHILFLADYDGTLTPIAPTPPQAVLSSSVRDKLAALAGQPSFSVGIITGRAMAEIKSMVGIPGIFYAGNHGLEMDGPGLSYLNPEAAAGRDVIHALAKKLAVELAEIPGIIVQDKDFSLSVHYRLVAGEAESRVRDIVRRLTNAPRREGKILVSTGKKVWEIRPPVDWHKGRAVLTIAELISRKLQKAGLMQVFLGDDVTDEDAFRVIRRPAGWSIFVGEANRASAAEYYLKSTAEVEDLITRLYGIK